MHVRGKSGISIWKFALRFLWIWGFCCFLIFFGILKQNVQHNALLMFMFQCFYAYSMSNYSKTYAPWWITNNVALWRIFPEEMIMQQLLMQTWSKCTVFNFQLYDGKATQLCNPPKKRNGKIWRKKMQKNFMIQKKCKLIQKCKKKEIMPKIANFQVIANMQKKCKLLCNLNFFPETTGESSDNNRGKWPCSPSMSMLACLLPRGWRVGATATGRG